MVNMRITGSVGLGGKNNPTDIKAVQIALNTLLNLIPSIKLLVEDGRLGTHPESSNTVAAIKVFQKKVVGMFKPDGKIDVNGKSHRKISTELIKYNNLITAQSSNLSTYFKWKEFACHDNGKTPVPEEYKKNAKELALQLDVLRLEIQKPININCAYRTPLHNKKIGGVANSQHLFAKAADIRIVGMTSVQVHKKIIELIDAGKMKQGGVGLYNSFVHYDIRGTVARWGG